MESEVATLLLKQYLDSLSEVSTSYSSDPIFHKFQALGEMLKADHPFRTSPESIPGLSRLSEYLAKWRSLKEQKMTTKRIFSLADSAFTITDLDSILHEVTEAIGRSKPNFQLDRFTFYESSPPQVVGFEEHQNRMVDLLSASGKGFKAVGIYGMGGSGKTALVKHVLKHLNVADELKPHNVIWACLSDLTSKDEIDMRIVKYLLNYSGFDIDEGLEEDHEEDEGLLMEHLEDRLAELGKYVIVLDDVWHCNEWLTGFCRKLAESNKTGAGGALIVTSRIEQVAKAIVGGRENPLLIHLEPFNYEKSNIIFEVMVKNDQQILDHIHGLPYAAQILPLVKSAEPSIHHSEGG